PRSRSYRPWASWRPSWWSSWSSAGGGAARAATQGSAASPATSAPSSNTCRLLARDHTAPEPALALSKAIQPCCGQVRTLAWCSRPRTSAASLEGALAACHVRRQQHADGRAPVLARIDVDGPAQRARALLDRVEARSPPLARAVVGDDRLDGPVPRLGDPDRDPGRRAPADRQVHGFTNDLVEPDLGVLREALAWVDV